MWTRRAAIAVFVWEKKKGGGGGVTSPAFVARDAFALSLQRLVSEARGDRTR